MKKFYLLLTFILAAKLLTAQEAPFITTWEVTANDLEIRIPNSTGDYNYSVDFGDGTIFNNQTSNTNHTYETPGIYTISITGVLPSYKVFFTDKQQIRTVEQWGDLEWEYMDYSFTDCENLIINATDTPNMSQVVTMKEMFKGCLSFNQNINSWDVSNVQDMEGLFDGASSFNQPLNNWNVSNVTNMKNMFNNAQSFNQNLSFWDISNVTNFLSMFRDAISFNQDLSNWQFNTGNLDNFLNNSGINSSNYENLLFHLSVLNIDNGNLGALNLEYCNQQPRDYLLNELNWDIFGDIPSETCNTIISTVSFDQDNNGCDENDIYSDNNPVLELIEKSMISYYKISAIRSPFETKDILKARNYFWDSSKKCWWKRITRSEIEPEEKWLAENVYNGYFQGRIEEIAIIDKYKD